MSGATTRTTVDAERSELDLTDAMRRRRLREEHSDDRSRDFLTRLGLPGTARCLEIGAGLGSMARWLATDLAPRGQVLATEVRPALVERIGRPAIGNLRALHHDVRAGDLPGRELDLIFGRFVLEHLAERDATVSRLAGGLAPGGWLVLEDASFDGAVLSGPPAYRSAMLAFVAGKPASDFRWADELPRRMEAAGLRDVRAQRVNDLFRSGSTTALFWAAVLAQEADAGGPLDPATAGGAIEVLTQGATWFTGPFVVQCAGRQLEADARGDA